MVFLQPQGLPSQVFSDTMPHPTFSKHPDTPLDLQPLSLVLFEPEIPPNTGSIARLCAAAMVRLHLIEPLGFSLEDKYLKRAGLDYWPSVDLRVWASWDDYVRAENPARVVVSSARQGQTYHTFTFQPGDALVLGPETRGLPAHMVEPFEHRVRIPIFGQVRSINLATAAGILLYAGLRSIGALDG